MRDIAEDAMGDVVDTAVVEEKDVKAGAEGAVLAEASRIAAANIASPTATVLTLVPCVKPRFLITSPLPRLPTCKVVAQPTVDDGVGRQIKILK